MDVRKLWKEEDGAVVLTEKAAEYISRPFITCSPRMEEQLSVLESTAKTGLRVLISGEPGTRKQLYAEHLHRCSSRAEGNYVRFDCAATHESQLDTVLFGRDTYTQGYSITGLAETASGGTLLLDGIQALPVGFFGKLESFLDTGAIRPQGSRTARSVDVRLVSVCGQDVTAFLNREPRAAALVQKLAAVRLDVLPLRRRPEDIALLALHDLAQANRRYGVNKRLGGQLLQAMLAYSWPGNERELQSFVEQLVLVSPGELLDDPAMLNATARLSASVTPGLGRQEAPVEPSLKQMVSAYELMIIRQSIRKHGSLRKAAKALGVAPSALSRKLSAEKEE